MGILWDTVFVRSYALLSSALLCCSLSPRVQVSESSRRTHPAEEHRQRFISCLWFGAVAMRRLRSDIRVCTVGVGLCQAGKTLDHPTGPLAKRVDGLLPPVPVFQGFRVPGFQRSERNVGTSSLCRMNSSIVVRGKLTVWAARASASRGMQCWIGSAVAARTLLTARIRLLAQVSFAQHHRRHHHPQHHHHHHNHHRSDARCICKRGPPMAANLHSWPWREDTFFSVPRPTSNHHHKLATSTRVRYSHPCSNMASSSIWLGGPPQNYRLKLPVQQYLSIGLLP